jgi:hypothetical protein
MAPNPIPCGALLEDGNTCNEQASVTKVDYVYCRTPQPGDLPNYTLLETHYHAFCPKCGERKVIETH